MQLSPESTKEQKDALSEALFQHANRMGTIGAAPEDIPEGFSVPTYSENFRPLYDNQLFPAVSTVEDLVKVGYVTPDGQSTPEGDMAIALRESGGLNEDYTLNDSGRAMLAKREDLLEPENLNLYGKAEELNLDDDGRGALGRFSLGVQELWKSTQNLADAIYEESKPYIDVIAEGVSTPEQQILGGPKDIGSIVEQAAQPLRTPEQKAATRIRTEEAIKGFSDQSVATLLGAGELIARATAAGPFPVAQRQLMALTNAANKDEAVLITRQARERMLNNVANVSVSEAVDQLTGVTEFVKSYQQAEEVLGPERTKEVQAQGAAMGLAASILNPAAPEAAAFGVGFKVAGKALAPISGSLLRAEQKASRVLAKTENLTALQKQAAEYQFAIKTIEQQAANAEATAAQLSKRGFVDRANSAITNANLIRRKAQETGVKLGGLQDEIARVSDDLATLTKDATVADKFNQMMQKAKEIPYMPITGVGTSLEYVGRGMIGIDKGLSKLASKIGVDKAYNAMNKISSLSGLGTVGAAAGLGPVAFIPAAIKAAWSTAPFIQGAGRFVNLIGKEAMKSRADIGFWKRIYQMPNQGPVNRAIAGFMDTATLGGRVTDFGVRTTKGVLAAVPADLAFQYVAEGGKMDAGSIGEALSESIFFGGAGSGLGAITMGSKRKIRSLQNGNALNFYRSLEDPNQRIMFNGMPEDYRRAIGTFSATNPGARVMFTTIGGGGIDPNTNTIYINPNSSNPIKPLVTHEFMHHMMNNGIGEGIVAQLVGDGYQTGGLLRTADGKYEPQYEAFKEEYVDRLRQQHAQMIKMREAIGDKIPASEREFQPPNEKYLAEEYFIESNVEDMLGLVESGKLGKMAGRMVINDKVRALGDSILDKSSILRDLHFKLGGVMDKNGKMVSGNGFLGGQMYQSPEIRRMFKKMVSDSVGRKGGFDKARVKAKEGVKLKINSKSDPILKSMVSMWEGDVDGVPFLDKDGDFIPLKKETEEIRATAGLLLIDDQNRRQANGEAIAEGQLTYNPDTQTWSGKYLTEDQIRILKLSGRFNNPQIRQLEMLNEAARATLDPNAAPSTRGNRFSIIYQAALKRNKKGKWRYDQIEPSLRDVVPYGVEISKKGNISIRIMSTNQLHANISKKAASNNGIKLYEGNIEAILRDVNRVIELHGEADGKPTDAHFKEKYGSQWEEHKKFINSVFGNVGAGHKDINPLVASDKVDAVVKTYRLDRINKATQMVGSTNLPYQNNLVKINYLPEGEPILDANGEPKDLRYTPRYEERMPEQRQMPEVSQEESKNWFKQNRSNFIHVNIRGNEIDSTRDFTGWVLPVGRDAVPDANIMNTRYGRVGKQVVLVPKEFVTTSRDKPVKIKEGFRPSPEQIGTITEESINKNGTIDWSKVFAKPTEPTPAPSQRFMPEKLDAENIEISEAFDEYGDIDYEASDAVNKIAKDRNLGITSDRELSRVAKDKSGRIIGGAFTSVDENTYSFDIVVSKEAEGKGVGSKLLDSVIKPDQELFEVYPNMKVSVDVVNPSMKKMLELRSFKVDQKIGKTRWIMSPSQRFMPEKLDADYMKAVESGDVGEQQRLVDEAAKEAGYNVSGIHFTASDLPFTVFDTTTSKFGRVQGTYLTDKENSWSKWVNGRKAMNLFVRFKNPADSAVLQKMGYRFPSGVEAKQWLVDRGYDGVIDTTMDEMVAFEPDQIKSADPITRDDSGNIIPLSKRFDITSKDLRFMPEPLPANYKSSRDTTFLYRSIGPDGIINLTRPVKSTEALPTISTRHEYPMEEFTVSKFDKRASILYTKNKNGEGVAFKFDPQLMKKPEFANFDDLYDGAVVQLAMADRHGATDGDMGGHAFPDLKVNQDILVDDGNGKQYKLVWSNNAWGPVKNMSTKAQKYGATTLLTYNMDPHAHDSNTRTVRIFSNEIANSNLSSKDQSTLLIVMNVALKKAQSSASKKDLRAFLKDKKDLVDTLKKDDKIKAKSPNGDSGLGVAEREALLLSLDDIQKQIDDENQFLKESLGAKLAGDEEVKVDSLFRNYQNKRRAYEKNTKSESRKKAMVDAENELKAYQKTKEFKKAEGLLPSRELDKFSNTFKGRKSLILAVKNKEASVKWHGFDSQKISQAIGDQLNGDSLHIVSSVELSSDPDFKAVYLGDDPREIARMSPQEQQAAQQLKSNPDFVPHEAYLWSMLGPAESKHIYNTNQRSVLESFPDFVNEYSQLPVKPGKLKLNDPNSKASEFNIVNTIRDQSKIKIVFRAKQGRSD